MIDRKIAIIAFILGCITLVLGIIGLILRFSKVIINELPSATLFVILLAILPLLTGIASIAYGLVTLFNAEPGQKEEKEYATYAILESILGLAMTISVIMML